MSRLTEIRQRLSQITPGEWHTQGMYEVTAGGKPVSLVAHVNSMNNRLFIAHAPQDITALLKVAEAAEEVIATYKYIAEESFDALNRQSAVNDLRSALKNLESENGV